MIWLAAAGLGLMVLVVTVWLITGGRVYSVQTGSMQPVLRPGDAVLIRPLSFDRLRPGQVVSFHDVAQPELVTTHRVVSVDRQRASFVTKGDYAASADLPHAARQLAGQAVFVAPGLGRWLERLRHPVGLVIGVFLPLTVVTAHEISRLRPARTVYRWR